MDPTRNVLLETAALSFAASVAEDGREAGTCSADGLRPVTAWCLRNAARVELLIALADDATRAWELDVALGLLWTARHGLGNVDPFPRPDLSGIGTRARALQDRIAQVARQALDRLDTQVANRVLTREARPEHFEALIRWVDDSRLPAESE